MHAELGARKDQRLLNAPHVGDHVDRLAQLHDRVPDELAGAVPGDLPAAVHVDHGRARVADRPVQRAGALARRVDRPVLEQQADIGDLPPHPPFVQYPLQVPGFLVRDRGGAEAGPGEDQLAVHASSLIENTPSDSGRFG
jgi:hypothetical protein